MITTCKAMMKKKIIPPKATFLGVSNRWRFMGIPGDREIARATPFINKTPGRGISGEENLLEEEKR
jgi:hypothetical protein